ncbi:Spore cortex-lytic enzyme SleB [Alkaliphilus metalliredigens QYMF]|uniref:Spore cortex-lytic enzyme n=1 Tax=Alkaliphilus metalliredigens (strain QYMF) TaxID=293826 RepID=A6TMZ9_ALKMQ|nr:spore cortex-lytic enzyme [Alkaliphilus metalliredigens]ABR47567.1 Spore cortex-lytic enzyme SleB [Alkaliphilus metalliredigens QYMF]
MKKSVWILLTIVISVLAANVIYYDSIYAQNLSWGSSGGEVTDLQERLTRWDYYDGPISGTYGPQTHEAVRLFQRINGLTVDGIVGPQTRGALGMGTTATPPTQSVSRGVSRSDDVELLARTIHSESKGEPYEGQVAVGAVILNRVSDAAFPNTMAGVVYQPCAFEPVKRGTINEAPNDSAYRAARDALNGWDPTGGALYFWNPVTATSRWIWTRTITLTIGRHVFGN